MNKCVCVCAVFMTPHIVLRCRHKSPCAFLHSGVWRYNADGFHVIDQFELKFSTHITRLACFLQFHNWFSNKATLFYHGVLWSVSHLFLQQGQRYASCVFSHVWYHCRVLDLHLWQTPGAWLVQFLCSFGVFSNDSNHYSMQLLRIMTPHITPQKWYGGTPINCSRSYCDNYSESNCHSNLGGEGSHLFWRLRVEVL